MTVLRFGETAGREISKRVLAPVADEAALALISSGDCAHLATIRVGAAQWYYDKDSAAAASAGSVVEPADGVGRFLIDNPLGDVPAARTLTGTSPIRIDGGASADLSANRTISITAASGGAAGSMSAADFSKLALYPAISGLTTGQPLRATGAATAAFGALDLANASAITGVAPAANVSREAGIEHSVRGIVTANVADLNSFTVAGNDGLTYAEGERVGLVGQSTAAENGIYVVGAVAVGAAPLTRAADWAAAAVLPPGSSMRANEGTLWSNSVWFATVAGSITVATTAPAFYPRKMSGTATLGGGTGTATVTTVWLLSTTKSHIAYSVNTVGGTQGLMNCPVASRTAGAGSGQFVLDSADNADTSTVDWCIFN